MSLRLLSVRILTKCVRNNATTKAYYLPAKNFQSLKMTSKNCGKSVISMFNTQKLSTTTESTAEGEDEEKVEERIRFPKEYTQAEIQAVFDGTEARNVPKKGSQARTVPVETSIKYLDSQAFTETYGEEPVWKQYRRNHKGTKPPVITRRTCVRKGVVSTGNPCPICRDDFLVVDYRNVKLLNQFISEFSGEVLTFTKTGVCRRQHSNLLMAIYKAKDYGLIKYDVPFRKYNYADYYPELKEAKKL